MKKFIKQASLKTFGITDLDPDALLYKQFPMLVLKALRKYFRLEVSGFENIPKDSRALIIANHSGFSGFDGFILAQEILHNTNRNPHVLTHKFWFASKLTKSIMNKYGFINATTENGIKKLTQDELIVLFPEGEYGNFKPTTKAYHLQEFKRGFIRMALQTQTPIIPTVILGAEETHITLKNFKLSKLVPGALLPLPLNLFPLPAKWRIRFFEPIYLPYGPEEANNTELVHEICEDIQERMQKALNQEVKKRGSAFF